MTSAGRLTRDSTCAIVNVLPDPVTPSRTCDLSPRRRPSVSWSMARGCSPRRSNSLSSAKRSETVRMIGASPTPSCYYFSFRGIGGRAAGSAIASGGKRREVARSRANFGAFELWLGELDLDLVELAVGLRIAWYVAERVARRE